MKKRMEVCLSVCLICCIFLLSGCSQDSVQDTVINAYESFLEMNGVIWVVGPEAHGPISHKDKVVTFEEGEFFIVDDENIKSLDGIKKSVEEVCTLKCAEEMFYKPYLEVSKIYIEKDGVLYRQFAEIPSTYGGELTDFKIIEKKKDYISAEIEYYSDLFSTYIIEISISLENGKWLVDSVEQIWYD